MNREKKKANCCYELWRVQQKATRRACYSRFFSLILTDYRIFGTKIREMRENYE